MTNQAPRSASWQEAPEPRVLFVGKSRRKLEDVRAIARQQGFELLAARKVAEAEDILEKEHVSLVLIAAHDEEAVELERRMRTRAKLQRAHVLFLESIRRESPALLRAKIGYFLDLDRELKRGAEETRHAKDLFHAILDGMSDGVILLDRKLTYFYINEVGAKLLDFSSIDEFYEFRNKTPNLDDKWTITTEEGRRISVDDLPGRRILKGERSPAPMVVQFHFHRSGRRRWLMLSSSAVDNEKGEIVYTVSILKDFTERKRDEERQRILAQTGKILSGSLDYDQTLNSIAKTIVPLLADWVYINLLDQEGEPRTAVTQHSNPERIREVEEIRKRFPRSWDAGIGDANVFKTGKSELYPVLNEDILALAYNDRARARVMMERFKPCSAMAIPLNAHGRVLGALVMVTAESGRRYDSSDLEFAEEFASRAALAIENALLFKQARDAIGYRDEFLSIASHELKTPITSLKLQIQMVRRHLDPSLGPSVSPEKLKWLFDVANTQIDRLTLLVSDLLDVSQLRGGKLRLRLESTDLSSVFEGTIERFLPQFESSKTQLMTAIQPGVVGFWDGARLDQVLLNLLSNALKYASGSLVQVELSEKDGWATLTVRDHGPGIPREHQQRIFGRFERAVSSKNVSGLGLGLFICREIVEAHQGTIMLESEAGKGAVFTVRIPG